MTTEQALLQVRDLQTVFHIDGSPVPVVDGISFQIMPGETLGIVGESGCGKSITSLSIMRLLPPNAKVRRGSILFDGENLLEKSIATMRTIRGRQIAMIFQEPMTSLNPVHTVGRQIAEVLETHEKLPPKTARAKVIELLQLVGISEPERRLWQYPHQLSGGMRQRVMIAMALACKPRLLIADEPTTALDVTIQAQILELMKELRRHYGMSIMLITHDLGVIADMADRVVVMYAGKIVEQAPVEALFQQPLHPYTEGLLHAIPRLDGTKQRLNVIEGTVPSPEQMPVGCRFHPRCPYAVPECQTVDPPLEDTGTEDGRQVACLRWREITTRGVA